MKDTEWVDLTLKRRRREKEFRSAFAIYNKLLTMKVGEKIVMVSPLGIRVFELVEERPPELVGINPTQIIVDDLLEE